MTTEVKNYMRRQNIKRSLRSRLQTLEAKVKANDGPAQRIGFITRELPPEYTGERHMAVIRVGGYDGYHREWCEVEERPGPAPRRPAEPLPQLCLTETQMKICFGPEFEWGAIRSDRPEATTVAKNCPCNISK
jgi:hypothetical protein